MASKLIPTKKPKGMPDDAFSSWRDEVHEEVREVFATTFDDAADQPAKPSFGEREPRPRLSRLGTDISRILEMTEELLDDPMFTHGPFHHYRNKLPMAVFQKNCIRLVEMQTEFAVKHAAKTVRGQWSNLTHQERAKYKWLAPDRDMKEIVADYKAGTWRPSETATPTT